MQRPNKIKIVKIAAIILISIFCFILIEYLWTIFNSERIEEFAKKLGVFSPLVIIIYIAFSHVLAPLVGTPAVLVSAVLFSIPKTVVFIYIAGLISAAINFWISRKFGRKLVLKLVGKKMMQKIDSFVEIFGIKILILSRLFGFSLFEVVSYAAGLTMMHFKKYFLITMVFSAIPATLFGIAFRKVNLQSSLTLFIWIGTIIATGAIFSFFIKRFIAKNRNNNKH